MLLLVYTRSGASAARTTSMHLSFCGCCRFNVSTIQLAVCAVDRIALSAVATSSICEVHKTVSADFTYRPRGKNWMLKSIYIQLNSIYFIAGLLVCVWAIQQTINCEQSSCVCVL
jgi:hypothetical protein